VTKPVVDPHAPVAPINGDKTLHPVVHAFNPKIFDDDLYYKTGTSFLADEGKAFVSIVPHSKYDLFNAMQIIHGWCAVTFSLYYYLHRNLLFEVHGELLCKGIGTLMYTCIIIYCIFQDKLVDYPDDKKWKYVEAWLEYEVRIYFSWILANCIFLIYARLFKFQSKWKRTEENLNIQTIWEKKNSMDFLHHLEDEASNFSLILSALLIDLKNEFAFDRQLLVEKYLLHALVAVRAMLIFGFMHNIQFSAKAQGKFWRAFYALTFLIYISYIVLYFNTDSVKNYETIRKVNY
jgi:hypothetical protein